MARMTKEEQAAFHREHAERAEMYQVIVTALDKAQNAVVALLSKVPHEQTSERASLVSTLDDLNDRRMVMASYLHSAQRWADPACFNHMDDY